MAQPILEHQRAVTPTTLWRAFMGSQSPRDFVESCVDDWATDLYDAIDQHFMERNLITHEGMNESQVFLALRDYVNEALQ